MKHLPRSLTMFAIGLSACVALAACSGGSTATESSSSPAASGTSASPSASASASGVTGQEALSGLLQARLSYQLETDPPTDEDFASGCTEVMAADAQEALATSMLDGITGQLSASGTPTDDIVGLPTQADAEAAAAEAIEWMCSSDGRPTPLTLDERAALIRSALIWMTQITVSDESAGCASFGQGDPQQAIDIATGVGLDEQTGADIAAEVVAAYC